MSPEEIRAAVDAIHPRVRPDGSINAARVAAEASLRERHGHPGYIARLDGPGRLRPAAPGLLSRVGAILLDPESWEPGLIRSVLSRRQR